MLRQLEARLDQVERSGRTEDAQRLRRELHELAGEVLDRDDPGTHLSLHRLPRGAGFLRVSSLEPPHGFLRASVGTSAAASIDYEFIPDPSLRRRLVLDNIRMEHMVHASIGSFDSRTAHFCSFCMYTQYQLEPILKYWMTNVGLEKRSFPRGQYPPTHYDRISCAWSKLYSRQGDKRKLSEVPYNELESDFPTIAILERTRQVRNEIAHRNPLPPSSGADYDVLINDPYAHPKKVGVARFIHARDLGQVRSALAEITGRVRDDLRIASKRSRGSR